VIFDISEFLLAAGFCQPPPQEPALGVVVREGQSELVLGGGFREAPEAPKEVGTRRRQEPVAGQLATSGEVVQQSEANRGAFRLSDRDGPVQFDYRRGIYPSERLVERGDRLPVGRASVEGTGVLGGDRSLEQVPPDGGV
jgi:hypothetical protein